MIKRVALVLLLSVCCTNTQAKLELLSVVFRHGDRAPDNNGLEMYPNDLYLNYSFEPMGLGGLTNQGKKREYVLGSYLRQLYGDFLGDTYYPYEVYARSTNTDRTKMSLQLVLAALYPPNQIQTWNNRLAWQPIPATYVPKLDDILMVPEECPKYLDARRKAETSSEFQNKLESFQEFMDLLTNKTGKTIANSNDMYFLYHGLMAEMSMNLTLPEWTEGIFPNGKLLDGINLEYEIFSYNVEMRKLNGGMLLRKIINDMTSHIARNGRRKIYLYSGHETNVAAVLQVLNVYTPHAPAYSSAVIIELHKEKGEYYVKVKYYKGIPSTHEEMTVPECKQNCLFGDFEKVLKNVIPSKEDIQCDKRSLRDNLKNGTMFLPFGITQPMLEDIEKEEAEDLLQ